MSTSPETRTFAAGGGRVLADIRRFVERAAGAHVPDAIVQDLQLAVTEACTNSIRHSGTDEIRVSITRLDDCLEIVVADDGVYRMNLPVVEGDADGHRGMYLMAALVDDFSLHRGTTDEAGTVVRLVKCSP